VFLSTVITSKNKILNSVSVAKYWSTTLHQFIPLYIAVKHISILVYLTHNTQHRFKILNNLKFVSRRPPIQKNYGKSFDKA
jgi:hypothetical protein